MTVQVKNVDELEFPAVTICNENLISRSIADALPGKAHYIFDDYGDDLPDYNYSTSILLSSQVKHTLFQRGRCPIALSNSWRSCPGFTTRGYDSDFVFIPYGLYTHFRVAITTCFFCIFGSIPCLYDSEKKPRNLAVSF